MVIPKDLFSNHFLQVWDVEEAVRHMTRLAEFKPLWIEEPTSPDDIMGHAKIGRALKQYGIGIATGEMCHNRVMFKQFLAGGAMDYCQIDACRLGGVNEILAVLLLAAKCGIPVCPHAGGVGLCEYVIHLSLFDYVCVSGTKDSRMTEYAEHLHEHFIEPANVQSGEYYPPERSGYAQMKADALEMYSYPDGQAWKNT
jgi:L-fuconate dehydratase